MLCRFGLTIQSPSPGAREGWCWCCTASEAAYSFSHRLRLHLISLLFAFLDDLFGYPVRLFLMSTFFWGAQVFLCRPFEWRSPSASERSPFDCDMIDFFLLATTFSQQNSPVSSSSRSILVSRLPVSLHSLGCSARFSGYKKFGVQKDWEGGLGHEIPKTGLVVIWFTHFSSLGMLIDF
ncbi:hypothetical protein EJ06DRAFT_285216 [Trichodelitschia bisporula]|uniref:Uncharacterized protein n=1 Tax=Trichodelitschia bisporula TaxID=703511 RepID=A0A6G1I5P3_9PEZI|nr:hypothetical protein EJ06DRAFT_285216 [Trichodelitschia bisporula]